MNIESVPTAEIIPYQQNNRKHSEQQVERISKSIKDFGFNQPLVLDQDKTVLVGHGRLLAAQRLGIEALPCLVVKGLSEAKKRAYRILDNKLQNDSEWDFEALGLELGFLEEQGFDLEGWGLDDLRELFPDEEDPETYEDEAGELPDESYLKLGDLIELGEHRLLCGDSTSSEDIDVLMKGKLAKLVYTDPPYGVDYDGGTTKREKLVNDDSTDIFEAVAPSIAIASEEKAPIYIWHADRYVSEVTRALANEGYEVRATIIWNKSLAQFGALSAQYKTKHEPCLYAFKKGNAPYWYGPTNEVTVWDVDRASKNEFHPTQKPIELAARALRNSSKKGDVVLDVFLGSGSTLIAADQLNRVCYGMEIDPKYCQVILERYQKHCSKVGKPFICRINGKEFKPPQA